MGNDAYSCCPFPLILSSSVPLNSQTKCKGLLDFFLFLFFIILLFFIFLFFIFYFFYNVGNLSKEEPFGVVSSQFVVVDVYVCN